MPDRAAPHLRVRMSATRMAWLASLALLPAAAWGLLLFGLPAAEVLAASVAAALAAELAVTLPRGRYTLSDGSAFFTGAVVAMMMPPGVPLYVPAVASVFGILVIKQTFGGLGRNWMNPAMGGVVFSLLSWPGLMSQWTAPLGNSAAGASVPPLEALRAALSAAGPRAGCPLGILAGAGYPFSTLDSAAVTWVNSHVLSPLGASLPSGSLDVLIGHVSGGIGGISVPLLLVGAALLLSRGVIRWHLPVFYLGTFAVLALVFGGLGTGQGWMAGGPLFQLLSGNIVLAAFYAAPDPVTSPLTDKGRCVLGVVLGVLTFFLRFFGQLGDGAAAAIVLGNCVCPLLDRWLERRRSHALNREAA
ncbi:MAG TPA: RnfABCDGE type electron transport complex subunit D [bacterium]|nr:RnfABCDGE type electron transport complex subunit D [bacterium]